MADKEADLVGWLRSKTKEELIKKYMDMVSDILDHQVQQDKRLVALEQGKSERSHCHIKEEAF